MYETYKSVTTPLQEKINIQKKLNWRNEMLDRETIWICLINGMQAFYACNISTLIDRFANIIAINSKNCGILTETKQDKSNVKRIVCFF